VQSIRSPNCTQQRSPVSHRVTVKYRNHTQIPKKSPTRSGEDPQIADDTKSVSPATKGTSKNRNTK
jgi:hypothetical protein